MKISLIVAAATNNVIGRDGGLPWHLSDDLKRFKELTIGKPVIITFDIRRKMMPASVAKKITKLVSPRSLSISVRHNSVFPVPAGAVRTPIPVILKKPVATVR